MLKAQGSIPSTLRKNKGSSLSWNAGIHTCKASARKAETGPVQGQTGMPNETLWREGKEKKSMLASMTPYDYLALKRWCGSVSNPGCGFGQTRSWPWGHFPGFKGSIRTVLTVVLGMRWNCEIILHLGILAGKCGVGKKVAEVFSR